MKLLDSLIQQNIYYAVKPYIPRGIQIFLRRILAQHKRKNNSHIWPINTNSTSRPVGWTGWPDDKKFALVLTHDVEGKTGLEKVPALVKLEQEYGLVSSFNFVPKRYDLSRKMRSYLKDNGFEIGVHGLCHDGKLYQSPSVFRERAQEINKYLKEWDAVGFRAPSMHHKLYWNCLLDIEYDASTFDTDPFEPQSDGIGSIFPMLINKCTLNHGADYTERNFKGFIELPYTLPQDFSLFILLKETTIGIWKRKIDWVIQNGGMVLLNTHPDYMNFDKSDCKREEYPVQLYRDFLEYVVTQYKGQFWHVLPKDLVSFMNNSNVRK